MKYRFLFIIIVLTLIVGGVLFVSTKPQTNTIKTSKRWTFQSIDTMKYSRDTSREKLNDPSFDTVIDTQVKNIAETGATHVGIATPYDEEFVPFLKRWVAAARKYHLNIWYRGNWSGWEQWFGYPKISREEHIAKTAIFIPAHPELFVDGDVFSACPECENGGPGNPQITGDIVGYRNFLIEEYQVTKRAFAKLNKNVASNYFSMNGDVARIIMDKPTTTALDGIVTIDHYVDSPQRLVRDIQSLAKQSGGNVVLGEFGAPIPDIHGNMSEEEQRTYLEKTFQAIAQVPELVGVNYWVNVGGSTKIWNDDGSARKAVQVVQHFFTPKIITGRLLNTLKEPITDATMLSGEKQISIHRDGTFDLLMLADIMPLQITGDAYVSKHHILTTNDISPIIMLEQKEESLWFKIRKFFYTILK